MTELQFLHWTWPLVAGIALCAAYWALRFREERDEARSAALEERLVAIGLARLLQKATAITKPPANPPAPKPN